jgi:hypothetical protein
VFSSHEWSGEWGGTLACSVTQDRSPSLARAAHLGQYDAS